ncbi:lipoprotein insertase outer membrane protein LolB [Oceanimonas sp. CHS3-5]|uniref:lipoprotein insertase outer membrane protein LolB n=1 Tax=Oceanimonas sp. CHS3-5 TaxID=3068186 RepID=UPI00273D1535|nr:lipoprotein insertase outer membrane protein LolB [Oceanimonas sp. CHS3-5]MDP5292686.1 lipoprotein insertase outer membrane protein LolB [Oceanimonas sp. CHS3-5]
MRTVLICLGMLLVTGCAYRAEEAPAGSWQAQKQQLAELDDWQLAARLGIITPDERGSLSLFWRQNSDDYRLNLTNVVGKRVFDLSRRNGRIELIDSEGQRHTATNARDLVYALTGWDLPVEQLADWIKGLPGDAATVSFDEDGRPARVLAHGWQLRYLGYTQIGELWLPSRLELSHDTTTLKLAVSRWELMP